MARKLTHGKRKYLVLMGIAGAIVLIDGLIFVHYRQQHFWREQFMANQAVTLGTNSGPSSHRPSNEDINSYKVAPTFPRYVLIPKLDIRARVRALSADNQGKIAAPNNIFDVGWYASSSKPGQAGVGFMDGHVSSWTAKGVFYKLGTLAPGDEITIVRGDNTRYTYVVSRLQKYAASNTDMQKILEAKSPGAAELNLMTCAGTVVKGTNEFSERLVVYTTLKNEP